MYTYLHPYRYVCIFVYRVAVDSGLRMPSSGYESIPSSFAAHDAGVANGSMGFLLLMCGVAELTSGAAIFDQAKGMYSNTIGIMIYVTEFISIVKGVNDSKIW
jgi:hypothetical protein